MEKVGIQFNLRSGGTTAKKVDYSAFADHLHRPLPSQRSANGLDYNISSTSLRCKRPHCPNRIFGLAYLNDLGCAEFSRGSDLFISLYNGEDPHARDGCNLHEHQANRTAADHDDIVTFARTRLFKTSY